ncbi:MAG: two-component system OmpR family response regulator [Polyangiales bacterium]|jgi:two-component system OmpR family response regulator
MTTRVLLIDDDVRLYELLQRYLTPHEVVVDHADNGNAGLTKLREGAYDAVLLDVMMPGMGGLEVLREIRTRSAVPVVMLTARGDETDRVVGLEMGADDYVPKPFAPRELLARLRAILRRVSPGLEAKRLSAGGVVLDLERREAKHEGTAVTLTGVEFDVLCVLVRRAGRVVPRGAILEALDRGTVGERTVDVHVASLRKKLGDELIATVRGAGYVFKS